MDREETAKANRWGWVPVAMPGVSRLIADRRKSEGAEWVAECWKRGVVDGEAGWFFAREGTLAIGTPWDTPELANFAAQQVTRSQALLVMRQREEVLHGQA